MGAAAKLPNFDELYAAIAALPEGETGEILGPGVLRTMSRPGRAHRASAKRLARQLGTLDLDVGGGWWFDTEAELRLPSGRLYVPDLCAWRLGPDDDLSFLDENPITRMPDWACEVLSRATQQGDRAIKLPFYSAAGISHVWVLDPAARTVEVYEATPRGPLLCAAVAGADTQALPPFDLPISPEVLFAAPRRRA
jgi:Uma2 family endonuclease